MHIKSPLFLGFLLTVCPLQWVSVPAVKTLRSFDGLQLPQKFSPNSSGRHLRSSHFGLSSSPHSQIQRPFRLQPSEMTHRGPNASYIFLFPCLGWGRSLCFTRLSQSHAPIPSSALGISASAARPPLPNGRGMASVFVHSRFFGFPHSHLTQPCAECVIFPAGLKVPREEELCFSLSCSVLIS